MSILYLSVYSTWNRNLKKRGDRTVHGPVLLAWRLDREKRWRLILHETEFTHLTFRRTTNFIIKSKNKCCCLSNRHLTFDLIMTLDERQNVAGFSFFKTFFNVRNI